MNTSRNSWNKPLLELFLPSLVVRLIQKIHILDSLEHDALFWVPSKSEEFSIKSVYRVHQNERFTNNSVISKSQWKRLWMSNLHGRHKSLLWRLLSDILPTRHKLGQIFHSGESNCLLCNAELESSHHLMLECPFITTIW